MASGSPSSRRTISTTGGDGRRRRARSPAGPPAARSSEQLDRRVAERLGRPSTSGRRQRRAAAAAQSASPAMPSGSRLVASTRTPGQRARSVSTSCGDRRRSGARSCPPPAGSRRRRSASSSRSSRRVPGARRVAPRSSEPGVAHAERAEHAAAMFRPSVTGASSTSQTPSARRGQPAGGRLGGQPGLAGAARPDDGGQPVRRAARRAPGRARRRGRRSWSAGRAGWCGPGAGRPPCGPLGSPAQQPRCSSLQRRPGSAAELVGQEPSQPLVRRPAPRRCDRRRPGAASAAASATRRNGWPPTSSSSSPTRAAPSPATQRARRPGPGRPRAAARPSDRAYDSRR